MTLSDDGINTIERWQLPFFESEPVHEPVDTTRVEDEAKTKGFRMGHWQGMEAGREEVEKLVCDIESLLDQMKRPFAGLDQTVTRELTAIAMTAARHIVRRELILDSEVVCDLFAKLWRLYHRLKAPLRYLLIPVTVPSWWNTRLR